jgi:hypothetical protein
MPSFTSEIPDLTRVGPLVEILLRADSDTELGQAAKEEPVALAIPVMAMIDTGAECSVIQEGLARKLGLSPTNVVQMGTPTSHLVQCYEFLVQFEFSNGVSIETAVLEAPLNNQPIQCLIGRDILSKAVLIYIGYHNQYTLSF